MARVKYHTYGRNGVKVSTQWLAVLRAADKAGVRFTVNSGHRTMAEQWRLYRLYKAGKGNLAAYPSPWAPHIRVGNPAHALDVNTRDGGEARLERWLDHQGVSATNTVRGEAWHLELDRAELRRLFKRHDRPGRGR